MKKTRTSLAENGECAPKQTCQVGQSKTTPVLLVPRFKIKSVSVSVVTTRRNREQHEAIEAAGENYEKRELVIEIDLEAPENV